MPSEQRILTDAEVEKYERQVARGGYLWYGHEISRALATIKHWQAEAQAQRERAERAERERDYLGFWAHSLSDAIRESDREVPV